MELSGKLHGGPAVPGDGQPLGRAIGRNLRQKFAVASGLPQAPHVRIEAVRQLVGNGNAGDAKQAKQSGEKLAVRDPSLHGWEAPFR